MVKRSSNSSCARFRIAHIVIKMHTYIQIRLIKGDDGYFNYLITKTTNLQYRNILDGNCA
jgi:hypothetical protein